MARILVVDDSPTEQVHLVNCLSAEGHQVSTADNGADGVDAVNRDAPDLVLMDVVMPGLNGFEATRKICKTDLTKHVPVIIVSSKSQRVDEVWGRRQGASGYLIKPVKADHLLAEVSRVLATGSAA